MLGLFAKLLKALNSDASPWQLAFGVSFGLITGLAPLAGLHNILVLLLVLCFRINLAAYLISSGAVSLVAMQLDLVMSRLGETILTAPALQSIWTQMYLSDFWQLTRFNHSLVMGSLATALALFIPVLFLAKWLTVKYREKLMAWVESLWITRVVKASRFWQFYAKLAH